MRKNLTIGMAEIGILHRLDQEGPLTLKIIGPQHDLELLGFVHGSYHGHVGLHTGGGSHRRYIITTAGLGFLARMKSYLQAVYPEEASEMVGRAK